MPGYKRGRQYAGAVARMRFASSKFAGNPRTLRPRSRSANGRFSKIARTALAGVNRLTRMIETKEAQRVGNLNVGLPHNDVANINDSVAGALNPFNISQGAGDPMSQTTGNRIGDSIAVKGLTIKAFFENALN